MRRVANPLHSAIRPSQQPARIHTCGRTLFRPEFFLDYSHHTQLYINPPPRTFSTGSSRPLRHPESALPSGLIQKINSQTATHYDFFPQTLPHGSPPGGRFIIDIPALRREYLQLAALTHPDRHPAADAKAKAEALSARVNEAYKTLVDPLLRAQYILGIKGIDVANDETAKTSDPELLGTVLEAQETIEEAEAEADLAALRLETTQRMTESVEQVGALLEADDIEGAKEEAVRLKYWNNIDEAIKNWEPGQDIRLVH